MFHIFKAAGWPIWLLLIASIVASALIIERLMFLRRQKILPDGLLDKAIRDLKTNKITELSIQRFQQDSLLGQVIATGLNQREESREDIRQSMEETGRLVALKLEKYLTTIGTIATLAPLLGLFGTVVGMIEIFGSQTASGADPVQLAHGISVALYNTGFGLLIAMPALIFHRHFRAQVNTYLTDMEAQAARLVDAIIKNRSSGDVA